MSLNICELNIVFTIKKKQFLALYVQHAPYKNIPNYVCKERVV